MPSLARGGPGHEVALGDDLTAFEPFQNDQLGVFPEVCQCRS